MIDIADPRLYDLTHYFIFELKIKPSLQLISNRVHLLLFLQVILQHTFTPAPAFMSNLHLCHVSGLINVISLVSVSCSVLCGAPALPSLTHFRVITWKSREVPEQCRAV